MSGRSFGIARHVKWLDLQIFCMIVLGDDEVDMALSVNVVVI
jgi:hypothetical protein